MKELILPKDYKSELNLHDTQLAIKTESYPRICTTFRRSGNWS